METSTQPAPSRERVVPKDSSQQVSINIPPPAYTPRRPLSLATLAAYQIQQHAHSNDSSLMSGRPLWTTMLNGAEDQDDVESSDGRDSISLRINTSVTVSKSNNLVCLTETPAEHANAIARAVVEAMHKNSSGQCGIPMIDEDGRPRPIKIEVDASMTVDGAGNVVGSENIISQVLRERNSLKRQRVEDEAESSQTAAKRRHSSQ